MDNIKRQRKIAFIMMLVSIVMISSGLVTSLIVGLKEDKQLTRKRMDEVKLEYEDYSTMISLFEEKRDGLYGSVFNNLTYETMFANNKVMFNEVSNYEAMVDEIKKNTNKMDKLCMDVYYPDSNVNSICNNYRTIFEQVNNYFVIDITEFNKNNLLSPSLSAPNGKLGGGRITNPASDETTIASVCTSTTFENKASGDLDKANDKVFDTQDALDEVNS